MSMTSSQVYELAQKLHESDTDVNPETEVKEEVQPENVETNDTIPEETNNVGDESTGQETVEESDKNKKTQYSKEEKERHAFTKLKNKEKQKRERLISDYESKIKTLSEELDKFKGLKKEHFDNDEDYVNYMVDRKMKEQESINLANAKQQMETEAFEELNQQRIMDCFPDEKDREIYNRLLATSAPQFVQLLEKADPDNAVLSYLDDSDVAPLLIRVLMTKPEIRNEILSKRNPYAKFMAIDNLAKRLEYARGIINKRNAANAANTQKEKTNKIPVIGKVSKTESTSMVDKNDPNYYNNMLREMNQKRGR